MLYFQYVKIMVKSMAQYRASFFLTIIAQFFTAFFSFIGVYFLFDRFGSLSGWTFGEVCLCFGVTNMAFALAECFARGFDTFGNLVSAGTFDRVLLRPRSSILQIFGGSIELGKIGRILQGAVVLAIGIGMIDGWNGFRVLCLAFMVISGCCIFTGIFILGATLCFWTVSSIEIVNIFTDGGRDIASYPLNIYNKWLARFFTYIVPFGLFNYLPLTYVVGKVNQPLYLLLPLAGILFIIPCIFVWRFGIRHYMSAGS